MKSYMILIVLMLSSNVIASTKISCIIIGKVASVEDVSSGDNDLFEVSFLVHRAEKFGYSWDVCSDYVGKTYSFKKSVASNRLKTNEQVTIHYYFSDSDMGGNRTTFNKVVSDLGEYKEKNELLFK